MRVTGVTNKLKITTNINDQIPEGIYQIVGHTKVCDFDLLEGCVVNRPLILSDSASKAFIQFTDIATGKYYDSKNLERPDVSIKS